MRFKLLADAIFQPERMCLSILREKYLRVFLINYNGDSESKAHWAISRAYLLARDRSPPFWSVEFPQRELFFVVSISFPKMISTRLLTLTTCLLWAFIALLFYPFLLSTTDESKKKSLSLLLPSRYERFNASRSISGFKFISHARSPHCGRERKQTVEAESHTAQHRSTRRTKSRESSPLVQQPINQIPFPKQFFSLLFFFSVALCECLSRASSLNLKIRAWDEKEDYENDFMTEKWRQKKWVKHKTEHNDNESDTIMRHL